jgi:hypothetical protein
VPLPATRILDTRNGTGATGPVTPGQSISVTVAGVGGVPSTGASAVVLNVTATEPTAGTFIAVYPAGQPVPNSSNINPGLGATVANLVEVQLGDGGAVDFYNNLGDVQIIADVEGYVSTTANGTAGLFNPVPASRVLDTRTGKGGTVGPVNAGQTIRFAATGGDTGVPASAGAVVFNLTATAPSIGSYITAYSDGTAQPLVSSNLNINANDTQANRVIVPIVDGYVNLFVCGVGPTCNDGGTIQLIADITGYFTGSSGASSGADFNSTGSDGPNYPTRLDDTRAGSGYADQGSSIAAGATLTIQVADRQGIPSMGSGFPPTAAVLDVTVVKPTVGTYVTVWPASLPMPVTSDINCDANQIQAGLVVVQLTSTGQVSIYNNSGTTDIVVDVEGYYS